MVQAYLIDKDGKFHPTPIEATEEQVLEVQDYHCTVEELIKNNPGKEILLIESRTTNPFNVSGIILG